MKITLNWLKDYVDAGLPQEELLERLSAAGLNIEDRRSLGDDLYVELEVTSNRPDCLSLIGVAREVSALSGKPLVIPTVEYKTSGVKVEDVASVDVLDAGLCPRYTARVIKGVKVGPSPAWMRKRLEAIGLRAVNNIADITNYVLMECGQPLHAFDYDRLNERRIVVRRAKAGETITAIDRKEYELKDDMLVIADAARPVAVAGVMGGLDTEVGDSTTNVLLESAYFEPVSIRRTSRALKLASDSSFRFERGVDWKGVDWASRRAASLMAEISGGEVLESVIDVQGEKPPVVKTSMRFSRLPVILGIDVPADEAVRILKALQFRILSRDAERVEVEVPSHRHDVEREIDLIEEVARHFGYDKFDVEKPISIAVTLPSKEDSIEEEVREMLVANGCNEVVTVPFVGDDPAGRACFWDAEEPLVVRNPVNKREGLLRRSLLPCFLRVKRHNQNHGVADISIFELSRVFLPKRGRKLPEEKRVVGILRDGDFADLKGILESLFAGLHVGERVTYRSSESAVFSQGAVITCGEAVLGQVGMVSDRMVVDYDLRGRPAYAEIDFKALVKEVADVVRYVPLPRFPAVERDLSVIIDAGVPWGKIRECVEGAGIETLREVRFVDLYSGEHLPEGKKSIAFRMIFRREDGTLTGEEATGAVETILERLKTEFKAELRS
ncbi:MAG: phenylalanine--tRNA ligase subunit beta [Planctomycetota bacterium]|nr:MAG: phenylalanine--tRNA ligase subunit beta [Planctomycetota bacterium]